jgi:1-acyl-sn-glycerol-3-phosphate acyltransferase
MAVEVEPPSWSGAAHTRNLASAALRMTYQLQVHGAHQVGTSGPLLLVTSCEAVLVGSILHAVAPRPLHVVANEAMQHALPDSVMAAAGDIPLSGPAAVLTQRRALAALLDGRAVVVAGAGAPVGYLVATTGVTVMPVVLLGATGRVPTDPPRPRSRIDVFFAPPVTVVVTGDPLRSRTRTAVTEQVRQLLIDAEELAGRRSGRT